MDQLPAVWSSFGTGGLATLIVLSIMFGWLLPRWTHKAIVAIQDKRLKEKDEQIAFLKEAYGTLAAANDALTAQLKGSLEIGRSASNVLNALPAAAATITAVAPTGGADGHEPSPV